MYKLRAAVTIADVSAEYRVEAAFGAGSRLECGITYPDPRLADLGSRGDRQSSEAVAANSDAAGYHAFRVELGVPEGGRDYAFGEAFPHEALFDQLHGVSFTKGCYVGQEIVSRMEHRGTARRRIVPVIGDRPLVEGVPVLAGKRRRRTDRIGVGVTGARDAAARSRRRVRREGIVSHGGRCVHHRRDPRLGRTSNHLLPTPDAVHAMANATSIDRCPWAGSDPLYVKYHDENGGVPPADDRRLFEKLILEGFQAGLSWITILRKREAFRRRFS